MGSDGPSFLSIKGGKESLAYRYSEGRSPGVVFLPGFQSTMDGNKAQALEKHCRRLGHAFCRFDYWGHGASSANFDDCTLSDWVSDASEMVTNVMSSRHRQQVVLVGSSMGGYIGCHVALQHPSKVVGLVGIAAAPDFLQDVFEGASLAQRHEWEENGFIALPTNYSSNPYSISWNLLKDARQNWSLLSGNTASEERIGIQCPVRLVHGRQDEDVHWKKSWELMERLETEDVVLSIIKDGDHRLSRPQDIDCIVRVLNGLLLDVK